MIWWFRIEVVSFVDTDVEVIIATVDVDEQSHETSKALVSPASAGYLLPDNTVNVDAKSKIYNPDIDGTVQRQYLKLPTKKANNNILCTPLSTRNGNI